MSMNLLRFFNGRNAAASLPDNRDATAPIARERLQILLAHERGLLGQPDLLVTLREEILAVVSRHIQLDPDKVTVKLERGKTVSTLEVDIEVPNGFEKLNAPAERRLGAA
jgi:cell division topological specificity factor